MKLELIRATPLCKAESATWFDGSPFDPLEEPKSGTLSLRLHNESARIFAEARALPDMIWVPGTEYLVVGERLRSLIVGCRLDDELKCSPSYIVGDVMRDPIAEYYVVHTSFQYEIADYTASDVIWCETIPVTVKRWIVDSSKVPPLDFFYACPNDWFISEEFAHELQVRSVTGVTCIEVEVH